jgi:carbon storage regulator
MLVLSRKAKERIVIDGNILITVVRVAGGRVQLGVEAPADVSIKRAELTGRPAAAPSICRSYSFTECLPVG